MASAQDLHDGKEGLLPAHLGINVDGWSREMNKHIAGAHQAGRDAALTGINTLIFGELEKGEGYKHLSTDERVEFQAAYRNSQPQVAVGIVVKATLRSAPEAFKAEAKAEAEATAGLFDKYERVKAALGKNGKPLEGAGPASSGPALLEEVDEALRTGPTADIDDLLKKRAALVG